MPDFEVHIDLEGQTRQVALAHSIRVRGTETILFKYDAHGLMMRAAFHWNRRLP
jgi:serine/threonine-protein kinase HipA